MRIRTKKSTEPKQYRPKPDGPPYKPKDLWETGVMSKNTTYEGIRNNDIEHYSVGGVTFIAPEWCQRVLGW
jgi:hypothetical protein